MTFSPSFIARVEARTGMALHEVPEGTEHDVLCGHIVARDHETNTFVVFVGWPEYECDLTGAPIWNPRQAARRVTLV